METTELNPSPALPAPVAAEPARADHAGPAAAPGSLTRFFRNSWAIARKELNYYFTTPLAYVLFAALLIVLGVVFVILLNQYLQQYQFAQQMLQYNPNALDQLNFTDAIFGPIMGLCGTLLLFIAPFITMRLIAEEKKQQTFQLLMTSPVRTSEIVAGKFGASLLLVGFALALTSTYPVLLNVVAADGGVEWQTALTTYAGLLLFSAALMSIGLFISSLTESQVVAAIVSFALSLVILFSENAAHVVNNETGKAMLEFIAITAHLRSFLIGKVSLADVTYFISTAVLGLFLTRTAIERSRW